MKQNEKLENKQTKIQINLLVKRQTDNQTRKDPNDKQTDFAKACKPTEIETGLQTNKKLVRQTVRQIETP